MISTYLHSLMLKSVPLAIANFLSSTFATLWEKQTQEMSEYLKTVNCSLSHVGSIAQYFLK